MEQERRSKCRDCDWFDDATDVCTLMNPWQEVDPEQDGCEDFVETRRMNKCKSCGLPVDKEPLCSLCRSDYEELKGIMEEHENKARKLYVNIPPIEQKG